MCDGWSCCTTLALLALLAPAAVAAAATVGQSSTGFGQCHDGRCYTPIIKKYVKTLYVIMILNAHSAATISGRCLRSADMVKLTSARFKIV
jgi:hypothetical protein